MKMYLVEFEVVCDNQPFIQVMAGETEEEVWNSAYEVSRVTGLSEGNFDMYPIYRRSNGLLELGEVE